MSEHQDDEMKIDQVGHEPHGGRSDLEPAASPQLPHVAPNSRAEVWAAIRAFAGACEQRARTPFLYFADAINGGDEREQCEARIERALDVFARSIQVGCATDSAQEQAVALPSEAQKNTTCNLDISQTTETVEQAKRNVDNPQDVLTRLHERIESKLVPSLNAGGTAFDMLVIVAEATRELRSELALGPAVRAEAEHRAEHLEAENERLKTALKLAEQASSRMFPIQGGPAIPWSVIAPCDRQARRNHSQSLERLAERGGLSPSEACDVLLALKWNTTPREGATDKMLAIVRERQANPRAEAAESRLKDVEAQLAAKETR